MDETNSSPNVAAQKAALDTSPAATEEKQSFTSPNVAEERPVSERRQAYGTAKTENLRDSGLWRILLPGFVALCCLAILAIPLTILGKLLYDSLNANAAANLQHDPLTWVWITMILIVLGITTIIIRGLIKIFMTQAGNY